MRLDAILRIQARCDPKQMFNGGNAFIRIVAGIPDIEAPGVHPGDQLPDKGISVSRGLGIQVKFGPVAGAQGQSFVNAAFAVDDAQDLPLLGLGKDHRLALSQRRFVKTDSIAHQPHVDHHNGTTAVWQVLRFGPNACIEVQILYNIRCQTEFGDILLNRAKVYRGQQFRLKEVVSHRKRHDHL